MTLAEAAENGDVGQLKVLLEAGADPNEATGDDWPPLLHAAYADQVDIARLLLDAGADMYKPHSGSETPLLMAGQSGSIGVFRLLIEHGYKFDAERDNGTYMLTCGRHINIVRFLLAQGMEVNTIDYQGCTALTYAANRAKLDIMAELIRSGADVNHRDNNGETVLMWCADTAGNTEALRLLIEHGADVNALNVAVEPSAITDALSWTMWHGDTEMIKVLLESGAKVDQSDALVRASSKGFSSAVRLLLEYGANPLAADCYGNFPLNIARDTGNYDIMSILLAATANRESTTL